MSLKKVLYNKYGILIKESESEFYHYLLENSERLYDYKNVLTEFSKKCSIRYFHNKKIKEISSLLLKEEIGRNIRSDIDGKGDAGNITDAQLIGNQLGMYVDEAIDPSSGEDVFYLEDDDKNNRYIEMENGYMNVFMKNIKKKNINK